MVDDEGAPPYAMTPSVVLARWTVGEPKTSRKRVLWDHSEHLIALKSSAW
jgi:hypothetical protein